MDDDVVATRDLDDEPFAVNTTNDTNGDTDDDDDGTVNLQVSA